jgi:hypothetical protein
MFRLQRQSIDGERISVIPNFLSATECQKLITRAEESGFKLSSPSGKLMIRMKIFLYVISRWWSWSYTS